MNQNMVEFKEMRRRRQQLPEEETVRLLHQATSGVLSLVDEDGYPYGVPLSYVRHGDKLYFHSALDGHKVDAIRHSDKASFCVICQDEVHPDTFTTHFRSVICFGRVRIIENATEKLNAARMLGRRYNPDEEALTEEINHGINRMLMIEFSIEHMTGKEAIELVRKRQTE